MTDATLSIRQMCETYDVTPRALRFYEAKELLRPIRQGTRRLYTRSDRARLTLILRGKRFGFSLEEIRQLLDLYAAGRETQLSRAVEVAERHLADMMERRATLDAAIEELQGQIAWGRGQLGRQVGGDAGGGTPDRDEPVAEARAARAAGRGEAARASAA